MKVQKNQVGIKLIYWKITENTRNFNWC
jgi:hypothetical protein